MSLRTIGPGMSTATFGTGDANVLSRESMVEPRFVDVLVDAVTGDVTHLVRGKHRVVKESRYASISEAGDVDNNISSGVTRRIVTASNEDFQRVVDEKETFE